MFSLSKILLPIDFSERSFRATRSAVPLAKQFNSELTLLHVISTHRDLTSAEGAVKWAAPPDALRAERGRDLDSFMREELRDLKLKRVVVEGDPAQEIVDHAHLEEFDLIMMATHGYGPFRRFLLGSVAAKVLHDAHCPVWTGIHAEQVSGIEAGRPTHIACAIDLDSQSRHTLNWAGHLAEELKAKLTVVHVVKSLVPHTLSFDLSPEWRKHVRDEAMTALDNLKKDLGVECAIKLEIGDVHKGVCLAARELIADLVVINRGTDGGFGGRLRTNAYAIIRDSPCPVISV
ncbi:MAG: universal stress protein [Acidobacteriia bacterium]|nr:universal stress protein [Terriglobia bacterium]